MRVQSVRLEENETNGLNIVDVLYEDLIQTNATEACFMSDEWKKAKDRALADIEQNDLDDIENTISQAQYSGFVAGFTYCLRELSYGNIDLLKAFVEAGRINRGEKPVTL